MKFLIYFMIGSFFPVMLCNETGNLNEYVDQLIETFKKENIKQIEPLALPDYSGERLKISGGLIHGLSSFKRVDDCTIFYNNNSMSIEGYVGVKDLNVKADYKAKALFFWISGSLEGTIESLHVKMVLNGTNGVMSLDSFKVTHLGDFILTKVTGVSFLFNWLLKLILNRIMQSSREAIISNFETFASQLIRENIKNLHSLPNL